MKPLSNNLIKRQTAWVMLALWLLAMASEVANACLLDAHEFTPQGIVASPVEKAQPAVAIYHGEETNLSRAPCIKVCDDGSQALQKKGMESDLTDPGPAFIVATLWGVATPVLLAVLPSDDPPILMAGLSLQIRYSRWAL